MSSSNNPIKLSVHLKWFERNHAAGSLREKSIKGGISTVIAQVISFTLNISSTVIMARMLLPGDYGLVAMVTSFTGFVLIFKDLGLAQAIIQREKLTQHEVSMVFWLNFYISLILGLLVFSMGPLLVAFYHEPKLITITIGYAFVAVLGGLSTQHSALLNRQMKFKVLSQITIASSVCSLAAGLFLAWRGYGYWAIVAVSVISSLVQTILLWVACDWRPQITKINKTIVEYVKFGAGITGFNMINYFSRNLDNILIGKFLGAQPLGLYTKAYQLFMLPISQLRDPLNAVGAPAMSSLFADKEKYRNYYKEYLFLLSFFSVPIVVFLFVCSKPVILLLLGEKWIGASYIFKLLAITGLIQPLESTRGMVLISSGQSRRYFLWGVYNAIAIIFSFCIGIRWGVPGIAIAYAICSYTILVPSLKFCYKNTPVKVSDFFATCLPAICFAVVGGIVAWLVSLQLQSFSILLQIIIPLIIFGIVYLLAWLPLSYTRKRLHGIYNLALSVVKKKRG